MKKSEPWKTELNRVSWIAAETNNKVYHLLIQRNPELLSLCGYVGVFKDHPLYGTVYSAVEMYNEFPPYVHGGLTFSGHLGEEYANHLWYFGFDCAHAGDYSPGLAEIIGSSTPLMQRALREETYRTMAYVKSGVNDLYKWLSEIYKEFIEKKPLIKDTNKSMFDFIEL